MRFLSALIGFLIIYTLAPSETTAADLSQVGPQASAEQIIQARGPSAEAVLHIEYATGNKQGSLHPGETDIAPDFVFVKDTFSATIFDYKLRRQIAIDSNHKTFGNISLYAMVDFREFESSHYRSQRDVLVKTGLPSSSVDIRDPFWNQQEVGIVAPDDGPINFARLVSPDGITFMIDGEDAGCYTPSTQLLSKEEMKGFARFVRETMNLHPMIVNDIVASGHLPSRISWLVINGANRTARTWHLISALQTSGTYPLDATYTPDLAPFISPARDGSEMEKLLPIMLSAVKSRLGEAARSPDEYMSAMSDALKRDAILQEYLLDSEFLLQYGNGTTACLNLLSTSTNCATAQDIADKWRHDSRTSAIIQSFETEKRDPKQAVAERDTIAHGDVADGYMFDIWAGKALAEAGDVKDALPRLSGGIQGNPYIGSFYKSLGDVYRREHAVYQAWLCYDLGRALPGETDIPNMRDIAKVEDDLFAHYPQYF